ncbi:MAG: ATP-binding cassette domain-containing protein [Acidobacteriota bacterium]
MIKVEGLTKRYARYTAVDHISFEVTKGQIVGFLGPNGAGKTTTMRMLTCFMPPSEGSAEVAGFDVMANPMEVKRRIGYLPETPPVYLDMEVAEYLEFVARIKNIPKAGRTQRINQVMERCSVGDVRNKEIGKLSKGYRQRVGLAQAILHNPDVLILDEPTAGLDPHQINETRSLIKELAGEHTIILSTHILPEVEQICERVVIIAKGKLVATDSVANLTSRLSGSESVAIEVIANDAALVREKLERVPGVSKVVFREPTLQEASSNRLRFTIEGAKEQHMRPELARMVVESGWQLNELHNMSLSLEEIFLELTGGKDPAGSGEAAKVQPISLPSPSGSAHSEAGQ